MRHAHRLSSLGAHGDHAREVHFMVKKRPCPQGAFYGQEATMPARCILWSRSDHARERSRPQVRLGIKKVHFMVKTRTLPGYLL
jgi:hypothetical protein